MPPDSLFNLAFQKLRKEEIYSLRCFCLDLPDPKDALFSLYKGSDKSTQRQINYWERLKELYIEGGEKEENALLRERFLKGENVKLPRLSLYELYEEFFPFTWRLAPLANLVKEYGGGVWDKFSQTKLWKCMEEEEREMTTFLNYQPAEFVYFPYPLSILCPCLTHRELLPILELKLLRQRSPLQKASSINEKKLTQARILQGKKERLTNSGPVTNILAAFYAGNIESIQSCIDWHESIKGEDAYLNAWEGYLYYRDLNKFYETVKLILLYFNPLTTIEETSRGLPLDIVDLVFHHCKSYSFLSAVLLNDLGYLSTCRFCLQQLQNAPPHITNKVLSEIKKGKKKNLYPLSVNLILSTFS